MKPETPRLPATGILHFLQGSHAEALALPLVPTLPAILDSLSGTPNLVIQAPPGSGKTTLLPLALLDAPWRGDGRILVLEPRRLAARMAAARMAALLDEAVGVRVGYRVRLDAKVSAATRIELNTDGVFLRRLQRDPSLEGVSAVLFDEVHERGLETDLALALCLETQAALRPDLRLVAMSATLDAAPFAKLMRNCPVVTGEGRSYPVETRWRPMAPQARLDVAMTSAVRAALTETEGDVLAFLPGIADIRRTEAALQESPLPGSVDICVLHGDLPGAQQDAAIRPSAPGRRKVVLSTAIAESSLTIEGVRVVIDSGYMRQPRFSLRSGMSALETVRVSQASAEQRRGRAGRVAPGVCYRLWAEAAHGGLPAFTAPEIAVADLAPLALDLALWGVRDANALAWLDPPPAPAMAQARHVLRELGALDAANAITAHGRAMAELPLHPRLAHLALRGHALGHGALACALAALLSERDIARPLGRERDADLRWRLEAVLNNRDAPMVPAGYRLEQNTLRTVRRLANEWRKRLGCDAFDGDVSASGLMVALAYPDRVAKRRGGAGGGFLMRSGRGAKLDAIDPLSREDYLAIAELDGGEADARVFLAAPVAEAEIAKEFASQIDTRETVQWDEREQVVLARRQQRLDALVLQDRAIANPSPEAIQAAMLDAVRKAGLAVLPWTPALRQWQSRVMLLRRVMPEAADWPDLSDAGLLAGLDGWLWPYLSGIARFSRLGEIDLRAALEAQLDYAARKRLDEWAPTHWTAPTGSNLPIDYGSGDAPFLAVRLQEMFGQRESPAICGGRVKLLLHLLSPARRPLQITADLEGFWRSSYKAVRAEMRGRYPKHEWPEDPLQALPTARAKPRPR